MRVIIVSLLQAIFLLLCVSCDSDPEKVTSQKIEDNILDIRVEAEIEEGAEGVLFAIGGISAGFTVYMDKGLLKAEYNAMTLNRYKIASETAIPTGKVQIEVETKFDSTERMAPATVTLKVNGEQVGQGRIERSVPGTFTASETFDVGVDFGSPVALDYSDRAPFEFSGKIDQIHIRYLGDSDVDFTRMPDDD